MDSPHRILVPVDFTESSRAALEYATVLGASFGAEVGVLHVWHPPEDTGSTTALLAEFARSDAGHKMIEWLATCEGRGDVTAHGCLAPGGRDDVTDAIVGVARAYDLIVMGTHGREGLSRVLRGRVADKVAKRATCPVVTVDAHSSAIEVDPGLGGWN